MKSELAERLKRNRLVASARAVKIAVNKHFGYRRVVPQYAPERTGPLVEEVRRKGYAVIPNFLDAESCASLQSLVDRMLQRYEATTKVYGDYDFRLYGADRVSSRMRAHFNHPLLVDTLQAYMGTYYYGGFVLAARIEAKEGNKGSGGGWHRDSPHGRQFKAITYLHDVDDDAGPFQYIEGSHRTTAFIRQVLKGCQGADQYRFDDGSYDQMFDESPGLRTFTATRGTTILVDTRGIHRGKPIAKGKRWVVSNYYYVLDQKIIKEKWRLVDPDEFSPID